MGRGLVGERDELRIEMSSVGLDGVAVESRWRQWERRGIEHWIESA